MLVPASLLRTLSRRVFVCAFISLLLWTRCGFPACDKTLQQHYRISIKSRVLALNTANLCFLLLPSALLPGPHLYWCSWGCVDIVFKIWVLRCFLSLYTNFRYVIWVYSFFFVSFARENTSVWPTRFPLGSLVEEREKVMFHEWLNGNTHMQHENGSCFF